MYIILFIIIINSKIKLRNQLDNTRLITIKMMKKYIKLYSTFNLIFKNIKILSICNIITAILNLGS